MSHTKFGDDAIVLFMDPVKQLHICVLTVKFVEGSIRDNHDDLGGYVGLLTYSVDAKNTIGANYTYLNGNNGVAGPGLKMSNIGIHANGNIAGFGYKGEADWQFGDVASGLKAKGYGGMLGLSYTVDPATLRASVAYGSGPKSGSDVHDFITFLDNGVGAAGTGGLTGDQHYTLVYEYQVNSTAGRRYSGLDNTTYGNIGADFIPVKGLKTSIDGYWIRATEANSPSGSKAAGWEVDGKILYNVAKNLDYQVDAGYFKAGKYYGDDRKGATS